MVGELGCILHLWFGVGVWVRALLLGGLVVCLGLVFGVLCSFWVLICLGFGVCFVDVFICVVGLVVVCFWFTFVVVFVDGLCVVVWFGF